MIKAFILRKILFAIAGLWFLKEGRFILDRFLNILTQRAFNYLGVKYPKLKFLKEV